MNRNENILAIIIATIVTLLIAMFAMLISLGVYTYMEHKEIIYTLQPYKGVGSGVYKHGTIVKVVDGKPVVVGHFDDDSGKEYSGTVQIEEVK